MDFEKILGNIDFIDQRFNVVEPIAYTDPHIFKYLKFPTDDSLVGWLKEPTLKFSTKSQLNDPFELSRRWHDFKVPIDQQRMSNFIKKTITNATESIENFLDFSVKTKFLKGEKLNRGMLRSMLKGPGSSEYLIFLRDYLLENIDTNLASIVELFQLQENSIFEKISTSIGIASFSESPTNKAMWSLYASNGEGFLVEYNIAQMTPIIQETTPRLMRVTYTDDRIQNFWDNPFSVALVKNTEFSFEREWRIIEKLDKLDILKTSKNSNIYVRKLPEGAINSIILGYNISSKDRNIIYDMAVNSKHIRIRDAAINLTKGTIEISE